MKKFLSIFLLVISIIGLISAQKIEANVEVTYSHLSQSPQNELQDFKTRLEEYINGYEWTQDRLEVFIPIKINIIVESQSLSSGTPQYQAQFLIATPSGENYYEKKWLFHYSKLEILTHDRVEYHQIANLLDYYIFLVIAGEADSHELLGGTEYFDKTRGILSQGTSAAAANWSGRERDFNQILNAEHSPLREAKYYFYQAVFLIEIAEGIDKEKIKEYTTTTCNKLMQVFKRRPNSKHLKRFMDSHYQQFCTLLKYDDNENNLLILKEVDALHKKEYDNCVE